MWPASTGTRYCVHRHRIRPREDHWTKVQARRELVAWIEDYNTDRRHSALNMRSPPQHEQQLRNGRSESGQAS
ncbi:integrase core domain-containing protein [Candidatus Mycobacterium methanotrophicum]|uniref:integrase core domain-containing protein n=1 Tax=Candidatus Mycobacterium methanotrophicum TaxID=2943498 RepID=UPI001C571F4A